MTTAQISLSWQDILSILSTLLAVIIVPLLVAIWKQHKNLTETHLKGIKEALEKIEESIDDKVSKGEFKLVCDASEGKIRDIEEDRKDLWRRVNKHGHLVTKNQDGTYSVGKVVVET